MNVKLVDLLMDDVFKAIKKHLGSNLQFKPDLIQIAGVMELWIKKRVPFLWWSRWKSIANLRYNVSSPYLVINFYDEEDYEVLRMGLKALEADLKNRGFLDRYSEISVGVGARAFR